MYESEILSLLKKLDMGNHSDSRPQRKIAILAFLQVTGFIRVLIRKNVNKIKKPEHTSVLVLREF